MLVKCHQNGKARMMTAQYEARTALRIQSLSKLSFRGSLRPELANSAEFIVQYREQTKPTRRWGVGVSIPSLSRDHHSKLKYSNSSIASKLFTSSSLAAASKFNITFMFYN